MYISRLHRRRVTPRTGTHVLWTGHLSHAPRGVDLPNSGNEANHLAARRPLSALTKPERDRSTVPLRYNPECGPVPVLLGRGMNTNARWALAPAVVALGVVLAGCSFTSTPTPTATRTVTATASSAATPPASASSSSAPSASATDNAGGDTGTGTGGQASDENASRCTTDNLKGAFAGRDAGASNVDEELQLTNTGTTDCTLQGWPGVSLVGDNNGTQIGQPAEFDRSTAHAVVSLKPGTTAVAHFHYVQADAFDQATCKPATGDGFRMYPPGSTTSLFIAASGVKGCTAGNEKIFTVGAFH